ncbi:MAG: PH domain-containing protein [Thermoproteota archaeon]
MAATLIFFPLIISSWLVLSILFFILHCLYKRSFTYCVGKESVKIERSGILSGYVKIISFDEIKEVHIQQGFLARKFNCGSLAFTLTGAGASYSEPIVITEGARTIFLGSILSILLKGRRNIFWDIKNPEKVADILRGEIVKWREAREQKMAVASIFRELGRLKRLLDEGAITQLEYEEAKRKLLVSIPQKTVTCKYCGTTYPESEIECPNCGAPRRP